MAEIRQIGWTLPSGVIHQSPSQEATWAIKVHGSPTAGLLRLGRHIDR
jgi:hypothetical protein